jgi:hypothetical protein
MLKLGSIRSDISRPSVLRGYVQATSTRDHHARPVKDHQALLTKALEHAVDVNRGQPERVAKLLLRKGASEGIVMDEADLTQTILEFSHQVSDPSDSVAAPEAD